MGKRVILGLDVSTSCLGTSVASYDGEKIEVLYVHYVKMKTSKKYKGTDALFFKSKQFKENFIDKVKEWGITDVVIEEPLPSSQNVGTVNTLMKFNGMISEAIYEATGIIPQYISSYDARKYAFPDLLAVRKFNKRDEENDIKKISKALRDNELVTFGNYPFDVQKKHILLTKISDLYPDIKWEYDKEDNLKTENFDASDSLVCILGFVNKEKYEDTQPKILSYHIHTEETGNYAYTITYQVNFCGQTFEKKMQLSKK